MQFVTRWSATYVLVLIMFFFKLTHCDLESKIVGGSFTHIELFPHAVFLVAQCKKKTWTCGSSVLNQKILLTAAHCVDGCKIKSKIDRVDALGGYEDYSKKLSIVRNLVDAIIHKEYKESPVENDISLLELERSFPLNENIKRVIISKSFPNEYEGKIAGWGIIDVPTMRLLSYACIQRIVCAKPLDRSEVVSSIAAEITREHSSQLKYTEQRLIPRKTCLSIRRITPGMFCAGSINPNVSHPASGDSGSALITSNFIEIGIVSFRNPLLPALTVYTNVTYYYNWILTNSRELVCT